MNRYDFVKLIIDFISVVHDKYSSAKQPDGDITVEINHILSELEKIISEYNYVMDSEKFTTVQRNDHPVIPYGRSALEKVNKEDDRLSIVINSIIEYAPWRYSYKPRTDLIDADKKIAFAELVGPDAILKSESIGLGLTLIAPGTRYPEHYHPAIELYNIVSGETKWTIGNNTRVRNRGEYILHKSNEVHAMETTLEPLLAIYTWSGTDIRTTSAYV